MAQITPYCPPYVLKRIQKDFTSLKKDPILNAAAQPKNNDLTFWGAIIRVAFSQAPKQIGCVGGF